MRLAILASGTGSILSAILEKGIAVDLVVADRDCRAEKLAADAGVMSLRIERGSYGSDFDRDAYTDAVRESLANHKVEVIAMAGFGTILGSSFFDDFHHRVLNTHPALLPSFPGWHGVRDALAAGVKVSGCTVHIATPIVDAGPILAQAAVPVLAGDSEASLHQRIKVVERELYPETLAAFIRDLERVEVT